MGIPNQCPKTDTLRYQSYFFHDNKIASKGQNKCPKGSGGGIDEDTQKMMDSEQAEGVCNGVGETAGKLVVLLVEKESGCQGPEEQVGPKGAA